MGKNKRRSTPNQSENQEVTSSSGFKLTRRKLLFWAGLACIGGGAMLGSRGDDYYFIGEYHGITSIETVLRFIDDIGIRKVALEGLLQGEVTNETVRDLKDIAHRRLQLTQRVESDIRNFLGQQGTNPIFIGIDPSNPLEVSLGQKIGYLQACQGWQQHTVIYQKVWIYQGQ